MGAVCIGNLRRANLEPSMNFRKPSTDRSVHFKKANMDPSMHFRKANTEFLLPVLLPTPNFTSKFTQKGPLKLRDHEVSEQLRLLWVLPAKPNHRQKICI